MRQSQYLTMIYDEVLEIRARKGSNSLWPKERYKHPFGRGVMQLGVSVGGNYHMNIGDVLLSMNGKKREVWGVGETGTYRLKAGDTILRSKTGKRLWKNFSYGEEDL